MANKNIASPKPHITRCRWAVRDPLLMDYHDNFWGQETSDEASYWEYFILEIFQAGLSWRTVLHKRENFRRAFKDFDAASIASFTDRDIARLLKDPLIIRSRRKINATRNNARLYCQLLKKGESFKSILANTLADLRLTPPLRDAQPRSRLSDVLTKSLKEKGFEHIGSVTLQAWLQALGILNGHEEICDLYAPNLPQNPPC